MLATVSHAAMAYKNMVKIKVANELLHSAQHGYEKESEQIEEMRKVRASFGLKKRYTMVKLIKEKKGAKQ